VQFLVLFAFEVFRVACLLVAERSDSTAVRTEQRPVAKVHRKMRVRGP
jgi:hypothetical protein